MRDVPPLLLLLLRSAGTRHNQRVMERQETKSVRTRREALTREDTQVERPRMKKGSQAETSGKGAHVGNLKLHDVYM